MLRLWCLHQCWKGDGQRWKQDWNHQKDETSVSEGFCACYYRMLGDQRNSNILYGNLSGSSVIKCNAAYELHSNVCLNMPTHSLTEISLFSSPETFSEWYISISEVIWNSLWLNLDRKAFYSVSGIECVVLMFPCCTKKAIQYNSEMKIKIKNASLHV